jgi:peptide subunit release factor 1 (eRF1)
MVQIFAAHEIRENGQYLLKCFQCPLAEKITISKDEKYAKVVCSNNTYELPIETMNEIAEECGMFKSNFESLFTKR